MTIRLRIAASRKSLTQLLRQRDLKIIFYHMESTTELTKQDQRDWTFTLINIGALIFLIALAVSAFFVPQLRLLHVLQGLIYVAIIILARRNSPWGLGAGVIISLAWNCLGLFITRLVQAGGGQLLSLIRTGRVTRPDTLMVFVGSIGHFILIVACMIAFIKLKPRKIQWAQFFGGGLLAVAYLLLIVSLTAPR